MRVGIAILFGLAQWLRKIHQEKMEKLIIV